MLVRPTPQNAERTWRALSTFGAPLAAVGVKPEDFATPGIVYQIGLWADAERLADPDAS